MASSAQRVAVLGLGQVGRVLCKQAQKVGVRVVAVADSTCAVCSEDLDAGFSDEQLQFLIDSKEAGKPMMDLELSMSSASPLPPLKRVAMAELVDTLAEAAAAAASAGVGVGGGASPVAPSAGHVILADCSAASSTTEALLQASKLGMPIVLANKKPLSGSIASFDQFRSRPDSFRHEATVGAGLPVIGTLDRQLNAGDRIQRIEGAFSGTLGYIFSALQEGKKFSEVVRTAKELGFTEPDPRDDLSGMDVARKALILARMIGGRMELDDIVVESLFPAEMSDIGVEEFMQRLDELDADVSAKVQLAQAKGCQLRYAATVSDGGQSIKVGIVEADAKNPLATLSGTNNMVAIHSQYYDNPLVVQGPGAGLEVTAAGVLSDIVSLRHLCQKSL